MTSPTAEVLLVGDALEASSRLADRLRERGYEVRHVASPDEAGGEADLLLVAAPVPRWPTDELVRALRRGSPETPIIVTGTSDAVQPEPLTRSGVFDVVLDAASQPERVLAAVGYALGARREDRELSYLRNRAASRAVLIGEHPAVRRVLEVVEQLGARSLNGAAPSILVVGETGTGKGVLARTIHLRSLRRNRPFVEINCAALPHHLVESELFGYERGAFTGAGRSRAGLLETAQGGSLFLDEIASLPLELQGKLLTCIEEKRYRRIGGRESRNVDVQIVAAAQPTLRELVKSGEFRNDLYHRLNVVRVELPPLRERGDDVLLLARRFIEEVSREYAIEPKVLDESAIEFIRSYHWPGNVRELRNQIERIALLSNETTISGWHFERVSGELTVPEFLRKKKSDRAPSNEIRIPLTESGISLDGVEAEVIRRCLELNDFNVSRTAKYLSITRQTLIYRMKKHGIDR